MKEYIKQNVKNVFIPAFVVGALLGLFFATSKPSGTSESPAAPGAITNINLHVKTNYSGQVEAWADIPFDTKRDAISPTMVYALSILRKRHPGAKEYVVSLLPDAAFAGSGLALGYGVYENGVFEVQNRIPTDQQIAEWNSRVGKEIKIDGVSYGVNDQPRLDKPDETKFKRAGLAVLTFFEIEKKGYGEKDAMTGTAKVLGLGLSEAKTYIRFALNYYNYTPGLGTTERVNL